MNKLNKSLIAIALGLVTFTSCKKDIPTYEQTSDTREGAWLSVQKAVNGMQSLTIFPQVEERKDIFTVNYGGLGLPADNINVDFTVDQEAFDSVNRVRATLGQPALKPFPAGSYSLDKTNGTIQAGSISSENISLTYYPSKFSLTDQYLLAIKATNSQGYNFRPGASTVLYYAAVIEKAHNKTGWSATVSSDQASEGGGNGIAAALIDNNPGTFWSSTWSPANIPFPHWAEVNFGKELYVTQIGLTRRQNNANGFKTFDVLGTKDGTTWITLLKDQKMVQTELDMQRFPIQPQYLSKIRIVMKDNFNNQLSTHLAEIDAIGY